MIISERIFYMMEKKNMTQLELSKRTGIATSNISDWKKKKTNPKADCLLSICDALEITPEQLLTGKGIDPEYVKALEQFCISKSETCLIYAFLLGARDKELEMYREAKSQRDALRGMWMEQNERVRDLEIELELGQFNCYKCRLKKWCMRIKRIKLNWFTKVWK